MDLNKLTLGDKIIGGTSIVLLITLVFLPWHSIKVSYAGYTSPAYTRSGIESPNSLWGLLALLLTIAILALVIVRRLTEVELPDAPRPWGELTFYGTIAVLALLFIKLIVETDFLGFGAYLSILLAGGMVYGGFLGRTETDAPSSGGAGNAGSQPPTPF